MGGIDHQKWGGLLYCFNHISGKIIYKMEKNKHLEIDKKHLKIMGKTMENIYQWLYIINEANRPCWHRRVHQVHTWDSEISI